MNFGTKMNIVTAILVINTAALLTKKEAEVFSLAMMDMGTTRSSTCRIEITEAVIHLASFNSDLKCLVR